VSNVVGGEALGMHVRGAREQNQTTRIAVEAISRRVDVELVAEVGYNSNRILERR